jgi:hypothetical protein
MKQNVCFYVSDLTMCLLYTIEWLNDCDSSIVKDVEGSGRGLF